MCEKRERPLYDPPRGRDLSTFSARGRVPLGICQVGSNPIWETCASGSNPQQDPAACSPVGLLPERGRCTTGGNAVEGCVNGSLLT